VARLALTGERTAPGWDHEQYWFARHEIVYRWLHDRSDDIADVGSGEGYGAQLLTAAGAFVVALELDQAACDHAHTVYPSVPIVRANAIAVPLRAGAVDTTISLQTIEHLWDVHLYLRELFRIARRQVIISTPNRLTFSPGLARKERPTNPFHVEEFDADQLVELLAAFGQVDVLGLHHGERIRAWESQHGPLVPQMITAALHNSWPPALLAFVTTITYADFVIMPRVHDALDLIGIGLHP
jgi:SAM-dependent methyltransferase